MYFLLYFIKILFFFYFFNNLYFSSLSSFHLSLSSPNAKACRCGCGRGSVISVPTDEGGGRRTAQPRGRGHLSVSSDPVTSSAIHRFSQISTDPVTATGESSRTEERKNEERKKEERERAKQKRK